MAKLTLQFGDRVVKDVSIGSRGARIGRLPDNAIQIDNPAVSSRHARVFEEGGHFFVEDLGSTNGTFVNEERVTKHTLKSGDTIIIGKHKIVFDQFGYADAAPEEGGADAQDL